MTKEQEERLIEEANKRELAWTKKRIDYNNSWPTQGEWNSDNQQVLDDWLKNQGVSQLFETVKLTDEAQEILFRQPKLNKLLSGVVDIYDELPYRPDQGFDIAWRSLEIFMNHQRNIAWKNDSDKTPHLIKRTINDMVMPLIDVEAGVKDMWEDFLADIPLSTLRYAIMRSYIEHDLAINEQLERVSERAEKTLTKALYDDIKKKYVFEENVKPTADVLRRSSLLLQKILRGEEVDVNGHRYQMAFENRMEYVLSCVLYANRCERFHGDYFSPFKSDRATLDTYAFSYYLLEFAYIYLWTLIYRHCDTQGIGEICKLESVQATAKMMQEKLKAIIAERKKK